MENLQLNGFKNQSICAREAMGLSKCFEAYSEYCSESDIMEIGFNTNSGYIYIALEFEPISICSMLGGDVEYLVTNYEDGEETFFDSYLEAVKYDNKITK